MIRSITLVLAALFAAGVQAQALDGRLKKIAATKTITAKKQLSRIDYNVFEGFACTGLPKATVSGGRIAWLDGDLRAKPGDGHYVERPAFSPVHGGS